MAKSNNTTSAPSVKPILFSAEMVCALLDGRKTQTRRVVSPPKKFPHDLICRPDLAFFDHQAWFHGEYETVGVIVDAPYSAGDLLWVRETWGINHTDYCSDPIPKERPADVRDDQMVYFATEDDPEIQAEMPKRPSLFMPRWASRLTLRVTNVRAERLQDISEADARAEGCAVQWAGDMSDGPSKFSDEVFREIWEELYPGNSPKAWRLNPWVWVYEFEVICKNVDEVA